MTAENRKNRPGPEPDRLKVEIDPQEALRRLLTKPPPEKAEGDGDDGEDDESERV